MPPMDQASEHFIQADKIRELRVKLAETQDEAERHVILRKIEELEDQAKARHQK